MDQDTWSEAIAGILKNKTVWGWIAAVLVFVLVAVFNRGKSSKQEPTPGRDIIINNNTSINNTNNNNR